MEKVTKEVIIVITLATLALTVAMPLGESYRIELTADIVVKTIYPGETTAFTITVTNLGSTTDNFDLTTIGCPVNWTANLIPTSLTLDPGKMADVTLEITAPPNTSDGDMALVNVIGTSRGDPNVFGTIETITIVELQPPFIVDLIILDNTEIIDPDESVQYNVTVINHGPAQDTITLTHSPLPTDWDVQIVPNTVTLVPEENREVYVFITPPSTVEHNDRGEFLLTGTSENDPDVSDSELTITIVKFPDVFGLDLTPPCECEIANPGDTVVYTFTLINTGTVQDTIHLNCSNPLPDWVVTLSDTTITLDSERSTDFTLTVNIPADAPGGVQLQTIILGISQGNASISDTSIATTFVNPAPTADAGPNQTVNEGDTVYFDGFGSSDARVPSDCFYDNFNDGDSEGWNPVSGTSSVQLGNLDGTGTNLMQLEAEATENAIIIFNETESLDWSNYQFEVDGKIEESNDSYSYLNFYFYSQSNTDVVNSYLLHMRADHETISIMKLINGVNTILGTIPYTVDFKVKYHLEFRLYNGNIEVYVDDQLIFDIYDATYSKGTVGLSTHTGGGGGKWVKSHFDNVLVVTTRPSQIFLYHWDFDSDVDTNNDGNFTNDMDGVGPAPTHTYGDNGLYIVTLNVTDENGRTDIDNMLVEVSNVVPSVEAGNDQTTDEGTLIGFIGNFTDPGWLDDHTVEWHFGDGGTVNGTLTPSHVYGDNGVYVVTLIVTDDDGGVGADNLTVVVHNVSPAVDAGDDQTTDEGNTLSFTGTFIDPGWLDTHSVIWDFGDGTVSNGTLTEENEEPNATGTITANHTYGDNGAYTVTLMVTDDDGGMGVSTFTVTVNNVAPTIEPFDPFLMIDEGSPIKMNATAFDPGSDDLRFEWVFELGPTIVNIHYNNGVGPDPYPSPWGTYPFSATDFVTHTYGDNYEYSITLTVTDDDGALASYGATIIVNNVEPQLDSLSGLTIFEGETATFSGHATDPGSDDLVFIWTWGHYGLNDTINIYLNDPPDLDPYPSPELNSRDITDSVSCTYGDNGVYTVTLMVEDDDGDISIITTNVTVINIAPTIDPFGPFTIDEGLSLGITATSSDPGSDDLTYTWEFELGPTVINVYFNNGVGSDPYPSPNGNYPFSATDSINHIYGDNGVYNVTLTVEDDDGGSVVYMTTITVNNVAPSGNIEASYSGDEGSPISLSANATDSGSDDLFFTWNWGDGTSNTVNIHYNDGMGSDAYPSPWGTYPFSALDNVDHIYGDNGVYTVTLTVEDDDGGSVINTTTVTVNNVAPSGIIGASYYGDEGSPILFMANASDPGSDDLTFTWNWDDGTSDTENIHYNDGTGPDPYPSPWGTYPFSVSDRVDHIYGDNGVYTVSLTIEDDDGGRIVYMTTVAVSNVAPSIAPFGPLTVDEGSPLNITTTSTDPGSDDLSFTWEFELGPTIVNIFYNDGVAPDPYPSPWGTYPFSVTDMVEHTYGDNGVYTLTLSVEDDDGGTTVHRTAITVNNIAPTIAPLGSFTANEGSQFNISATTTDPGSDDLTFTWEFELGPTIVNVYYNDGAAPDPYPSPWGTYPFSAADTVEHTYGDNGVYTITLSVEDDDGGTSIYVTTITINNVAPTIYPFGPYTIDEGSPINLSTIAIDPGSDDLTFTWNFEFGPSIVNIYYNNGLGPDPYPSPWGTFPFSAMDEVAHVYGDNGNYTVTLTVEDDDGGSASYATTVSVNNVVPTIEPFGPFTIDEGSPLTLIAPSTDPGSDDLTFTWVFELGPTITNIHYNDGIAPDPYPSPWGTFPFSATDLVEHTYGDNGLYTVTLTVEDDDGGATNYSTTITVNNVAPTIEPFGSYTVDEGSPLNLTAISIDPGSDDLTFTWEFELGPTISNKYYNDGAAPDPYPSPWGTFPFMITDIVQHTYGDNGLYMVTLTVEDDDGGITTYTTTITVNNVAPTVNIEAFIFVDFTLRVAGEKWHNVEMYISEDDAMIASAEVIRYPGSPDDQSVTLFDVKCHVTKVIDVTVLYTPDDDPINGQPYGADPSWVKLGFEDGIEVTFHHTFVVKHPKTWEWNIGVNEYFVGHEITFEANATDPGSDDLTFNWVWGDGTPDNATIYYNDGIGPDPYPSPWGTYPFTILDVKKHTYIGKGNYIVTLTVTDDDGGSTVSTVVVILS